MLDVVGQRVLRFLAGIQVSDSAKCERERRQPWLDGDQLGGEQKLNILTIHGGISVWHREREPPPRSSCCSWAGLWGKHGGAYCFAMILGNACSKLGADVGASFLASELGVL